MTPRGLLVDFGGVLSTNQFDSLLACCHREGLPADAFDPLLHSPTGASMIADLELGRISQEEFALAAARMTGVAPENLFERIAVDLRPQPAVLAAVARVRARGCRVGVLSNSWGSAPYDPYVPWRLDEHFDTVVISDLVGLRKPDPAIYRLAAARLGVLPRECVYVDDHAGYLEPAARLGMATVHATAPERTAEAIEAHFAVAAQEGS